MEISHSSMPFYQRFYDSYRLLRSTDNIDEKIALENYIGSLYTEMMLVSNHSFSPDFMRIFGGKKEYKKFQKKLYSFDHEMLQQYLHDKSYHQKFFQELLDSVEEILSSLEYHDYTGDVELSKEEFNDVFLSFMKSLNLEDFYLDFLQKNYIHSSHKEYIGDSYEGGIAFNPVNRDINIFIMDFEYNIQTLFVLAHEFGHAYDFSLFDEEIEDYNRYFYQSFYSEVFSKLFERLFLQYLIDSDLYLDVVKKKTALMMLNNYDFFLTSYMVSLLEDEYISELDMDSLDPFDVYQRVEHHFDKDLAMFIDSMEEISIAEENSYAYGDIISLFLKKDVLENGFSGELVTDFLRNRSSIFQRKFLDRYSIHPESYFDLYEKDYQFVKK